MLRGRRLPPKQRERGALLTRSRAFRQWRALLGWRQADAAEVLEVTPQTIRTWESLRVAVPVVVVKYLRLVAAYHGLIPREDVPLEDVPPPKEQPPDPHRTWDVTYVLARAVPPQSQCWFARPALPCQGARFQFVVLLPPTLNENTRFEVLTCEVHAQEALYYLRRETIKEKTRWVKSPTKLAWFVEWEASLGLTRTEEDLV